MQVVGTASCLTMILYHSYFCSFVSLFPYSYHKLMVAEYKSKREKFQATKQQAIEDWRPVREMERVMDVELFLRIQDQCRR